MKKVLVLLVFCTGILFFKPVIAQDTTAIQTQNEQIDAEEGTADNSVILLSEERGKSFSFATILRGLLGMAALVFLGFILSTDRKNIP
ncbi:MAG: hypothetical protein ACOCVA_02965, partial [Prolixibacteraceae bacterium]